METPNQDDEHSSRRNINRQDLLEAWANLCNTRTTAGLWLNVNSLNDDGHGGYQCPHLRQALVTASGCFPEPVLSVCVFMLYEASRQDAPEPSNFLFDLRSTLGLLALRPQMLLHARRQHNQPVLPVLYDHLYGLYAVRSLASKPIEFKTIFDITNVLDPATSISIAFRTWAQNPSVPSWWADNENFRLMLMWIIRNRVLTNFQPETHPLVTLMVEIEGWGAAQYVKGILANHNVGRADVDRAGSDLTYQVLTNHAEQPVTPDIDHGGFALDRRSRYAIPQDAWLRQGAAAFVNPQISERTGLHDSNINEHILPPAIKQEDDIVPTAIKREDDIVPTAIKQEDVVPNAVKREDDRHRGL